MKRISKSVIILGAALLSLAVSAQKFEGIATYKSSMKLDDSALKNSNNTAIPDEMKEKIMESLKKNFEKTYTLTFNQNESIYKEEEGLSAPQQSNIKIVNSAGSAITYKNLKTKSTIKETDFFGKIFLIKDKIEVPKWELINETKQIGNYTCYKAQRTLKVKKPKSTIRVISDKSEADKESNLIEEEVTITAWYTSQIPVSNGPEGYDGLPGLILQINNGEMTLVCSKIVLNPKQGIKIKVPTKGKLVTSKEFHKIAEKRTIENVKSQFGNQKPN